MPDPLVTVQDLEDRLGRELTDTEAARVDAVIADASASVRAYTGQTFDSETTTDRLKIRYGLVRLPQRPVVDVVAVQDLNGNDVTYEWDTKDRVTVNLCHPLNWFEMEPYRVTPRYVDVEYEHGYETVPDDVIGVVCSIVLRSLGQTPTDTGVISESIDEYTYRLGPAAAAGGFGLLPDERSILDRYRRLGGSIALAVP